MIWRGAFFRRKRNLTLTREEMELAIELANERIELVDAVVLVDW